MASARLFLTHVKLILIGGTHVTHCNLCIKGGWGPAVPDGWLGGHRNAGWVARGSACASAGLDTESVEERRVSTERIRFQTHPDRERRSPIERAPGPRHEERRGSTQRTPGPDRQSAGPRHKERRAPTQRAPGPDTKSAGPRHRAPCPNTKKECRLRTQSDGPRPLRPDTKSAGIGPPGPDTDPDRQRPDT